MIERMGLGYTSTDALESRTTSTEIKCQRMEKEGGNCVFPKVLQLSCPNHRMSSAEFKKVRR